MNLKIKITLETARLLILRRSTRRRSWCDSCRAETDFAPESEVAELLAKLEKTADSDGVHTAAASDGTRLVCLASLFKD
jgi:hypothetical protein